MTLAWQVLCMWHADVKLEKQLDLTDTHGLCMYSVTSSKVSTRMKVCTRLDAVLVLIWRSP